MNKNNNVLKYGNLSYVAFNYGDKKNVNDFKVIIPSLPEIF